MTVEYLDDVLLVILCALSIYFMIGQLTLLSSVNMNGMKKALQIQTSAVVFTALWIVLYRGLYVFNMEPVLFEKWNIFIRDIGWVWMAYGAYRFKKSLKECK